MFTAVVVVALGILLCVAVYFGVRQIRRMQAELVSLHQCQTLACTTAEIEDAARDAVQSALQPAVQRAVNTAVRALETSHAARAVPPAGPTAAAASTDAGTHASAPAAHERPSSTRTATEAKYATVRESLPATPRPATPGP